MMQSHRNDVFKDKRSKYSKKHRIVIAEGYDWYFNFSFALLLSWQESLRPCYTVLFVLQLAMQFYFSEM